MPSRAASEAELEGIALRPPRRGRALHRVVGLGEGLLGGDVATEDPDVVRRGIEVGERVQIEAACAAEGVRPGDEPAVRQRHASPAAAPGEGRCEERG